MQRGKGKSIWEREMLMAMGWNKKGDYLGRYGNVILGIKESCLYFLKGKACVSCKFSLDTAGFGHLSVI